MIISGIIKYLKLLENPENILGMKRFGTVTKKAFGVSAPVLKNFAQEISKRNLSLNKLAVGNRRKN